MKSLLKPHHRNALIALTLFLFVGGTFLILITTTSIPQPRTLISHITQGFVHISAQAGLVSHNIQVSGHVFLPEKRILDLAQIYTSQPILTAHPSQIADRLIHKYSWIRNLSIKRTFPHSLSLHVQEYNPSALWKLSSFPQGLFVSFDGHLISHSPHDNFSPRIQKYLNSLPTLFGENPSLPQEWIRILPLIQTFPELSKNLVKAHFVSNRRWNLTLASGTIIKLPETQFKASLQTLQHLHIKHKILLRNIHFLDLRFLPQIIVQPHPQKHHPQNSSSLLSYLPE